MKHKLLALHTILPDEMHELEERFDVIKLWERLDPEETIRKNAHEIKAILSTYNCSGVTSRLIEALPNLEIIAQFGAGYDNIDVQAAKSRSISVTTTPDVLTADTADVAMTLLMNLSRRAVEADMFVRVGRWQQGAFPLSTSLSGKTVGIYGLGKIGQAIAKRAQAFDMDVIYNSRNVKDVAYEYVKTLVELAERSDFLVLACAGGTETANKVNYDILKALGPRGYLINIARGSVVNQEDLLIALTNRDIAGAGLDVYWNEPFIPEAMVKMDHVVLSPHVGSATHETRAKMGRMVIANLDAHFAGDNLISPLVL